MCGIWGYLGVKPISSEKFLENFASIKHRGPDDSLIFCDGEFYSSPLSSSYTQSTYPALAKDGKFMLGFHRLSIVDTSEKAMQPFYCKERKITFAMVGEVYNYRQLRHQFLSKECFFSQSDAEVVFRLYLHLGEDFIHKLEGMYSIVIFDEAKKELLVFSDRMRQKPFFYSLVNGCFYFASEIAPLLRCVPKKVNLEQLAHACYLGTSYAPNTPFENILSLQPAEKLIFSLETAKAKTERYWKFKISRGLSARDSESFERLCQETLPIHTTGEVPQAVMLSGGTDSGILAYYLKQSNPDLQAVTLGSPEISTDARLAKLTAHQVGLTQHFVPLPWLENYELLEPYLYSEEEPNFSIEPQSIVSQFAHSIGIKVLFSGLGPDEIFLGYRYHELFQKYFRVNGKPKRLYALGLKFKSKEKFDAIEQWGALALPFLARAIHPWNFLKKHFELRENTPHPIFNIIEDLKMTYPEWDELNDIQKIQLLDIHYYICSHHTFRTDQAAMKHGVEVRSPYLDHNWMSASLEFSQTIKKVNFGKKLFMQNVALNKLPVEITHSSKMGFSTSLLDIISPKLLEKMTKEIGYKEKFQPNRIWHLYSIHKWMKKFV